MMRSNDPLADFSRWDREEMEHEKLFPVCDCCGCRITDETYFRIRYMRKDITICHDCAEECQTEDYVEEKKNEYGFNF